MGLKIRERGGRKKNNHKDRLQEGRSDEVFGIVSFTLTRLEVLPGDIKGCLGAWMKLLPWSLMVRKRTQCVEEGYNTLGVSRSFVS